MRTVLLSHVSLQSAEMSNTPSYRTPILCILPDRDYSEPALRDYCRFRYQREIIHSLEVHGFEAVRAIRTTDSSPYAPDYTALRHNRRCCIYIPEVATSVMRISHLSAEQCQYCEQHCGQGDAYAAALFISGENELKLLLPVRVRRGNAWIDSEAAEQFLPFAMRRHINYFAPLLGGAHVFKLACIIIPFLLSMGGKARFRVAGVSPDNEWQEPRPPYSVLLVETAHSIFSLMYSKSGESPKLARPIFYHEEIAHCPLLLISRTCLDHICLVKLRTDSGQILHASSLDALVIPEYVPTGHRYDWSLSLVAETCRQENEQSEPRITQTGTSPFTSLSGQICALHELKVCERPITVAEVTFDSGHETDRLCVYLAGEVTGGYTPTKGDSITCTGILRAAPRNILED